MEESEGDGLSGSGTPILNSKESLEKREQRKWAMEGEKFVWEVRRRRDTLHGGGVGVWGWG